MNCKVLLLALLSALPVTGAVAAPRILTEAQMRRLAIAGAKVWAPGTLKLPRFGFDRYNHAGYAYFEAWTSVGQGTAGHYAIDPRTGDMWDGVSECGEITSPEIRRLQRILRKQLGLNPAEYRAIKRRGPMCDQLTK
jgi:hypothetical protein